MGGVTGSSLPCRKAFLASVGKMCLDEGNSRLGWTNWGAIAGVTSKNGLTLGGGHTM